ncbi:MAG: YqaJ viral recombinase family protein [Oscillospiraceae bacterium]|nr:YqaJ viral recombinase family protein [Oscillospiraceae bacterium]MBQ9643857.1 YqaJ viral recombinase family protein [Lachnospiraceae bacterium]
MILADPQTREEWLECRRQGIGGSDAACIVGENPWKSTVQLWREKTGKTIPEDIGDKPAVRFGKEAEAHIRALFLLTYPEYSCEYHEFRMYANACHPWLYATLDGELTDADGRRGILEIKTTTIQTAKQWGEWGFRREHPEDKIPQHYYIQVLHQFLACEWAEYAELFAHIRWHKADDVRATLRKYRIDRRSSQTQADMKWLEKRETAFWKMVQDGTEPPYLLPEI